MGNTRIAIGLLGAALAACVVGEEDTGDGSLGDASLDGGVVADAAADGALDDGGASDAASDAGADATSEDGGTQDAAVDAGGPGDPALIDADDFEFAGAFRVRAAAFGDSNANYAEGPFEIADGSLYMVGHNHHQAIAEFEVPDLVKSETLADLPMADMPPQPFVRVFGRVDDNPQVLDRIGGLKRVGDALLVNVYEYYDAPGDNTHTTLVFRDADDLAGSAVASFFSLQGRAHASGWFSDVPTSLQDALGGSLIAGNSSGQPIILRLSVGPSAFALDPAALTDPDAEPGEVATTRLLDYSLDNPLHDDLLNEAGDNDLWTHLSRAVYGFVVPGTRTYATFGHSGGHGPTGICYKCIPEGKEASCGGYCARDPQDYGLMYWFFDLDDLEAVRAGELAPHEVRPYAYGPFDAPFAGRKLGGGAYDADAGLLYLSMDRADDGQGQYSNPPVFVAFRLR